jgi:hypothetical protein
VGWHPEFSEEGMAKMAVTQEERDRQSVTLELPVPEGQVVGDFTLSKVSALVCLLYRKSLYREILRIL